MDRTFKSIDGPSAAESWKEVVSQFRRLCFMRRQGRVADSCAILKDQLPNKIAEWSRVTGEDPESKRVRLEQMFREEQRRVDEAWAFHDLSTMHWQQEMVPVLTGKIVQEIKSIVSEQLVAQAERQKELGRELQTLSEQVHVENTRQAAQENLLQEVQKAVTDAVKKLPTTPLPPERIPFDDIPAIIDQINASEPPSRRRAGNRTSFNVLGQSAESSSTNRDPSRDVHEAVA